MISNNIFNSDIFSGKKLYIDEVKTTGEKSVFEAPINQFGTGAGSSIISLRSGQLGVGMVDPKFPLHVNGDGRLGGDFGVSGDSTIEGDGFVVSNSYVGKNFGVSGDATIEGDLTVNGESFVVEAAVVKIEDKNIELGISSTGNSTDVTANGGGITLHGDTPKTILWNNATDSWDFSEHIGVADGKYIFTDKVRARDSEGLSLEDDGGNGIFIEDGGDVGIGTTNPAVGLEINHTDALKIPKGTTVQRPTSNSATHKGYIRYNTTTDQFEGFGAGNAWGSLGGVVDVDQDTYISAENSAGSDNDELKFFTSGSARAIIDSAGNVGIGTVNPDAKLNLHTSTEWGSITNQALTISNLGYAGSVASPHSLGLIKWATNADAIAASIDAIRVNPQAGNGTDLTFSTNPGGTNNLVEEAMRITSAGNVGIGTTSPSHDLTLGSPTSPGTTSERLKIYRGSDDPGENLEIGYNSITVTRDANPLASAQSIFSIKQKGSDGTRTAMHIDTESRVGIGTVTPATSLEVCGAHGSQFRISRDTSTATQYCEIFGGASIMKFKSVSSTPANAAHSLFSFVSDDGTDELERMRIDAAGNVGIGTTSPISPLTVWGANDTTFDNIGNVTFIGTDAYNSNAGAGIIFGGRYNSGNDVTTFGQISSIKENNTDGNYKAALTFGTRDGSTTTMEKMRITSAGNVGIGTTSPNEKLDLNGILYLRNSAAPSTTTNRLYASGGNLFWNGQNVNTLRAITSTPANGANTTSISSHWAFNNVKTSVPAGAIFTDTWRAITSTPANGANTTSISSHWAFNNVKTSVPAGAIFTDSNTTYSAGNGLGLTGTVFSVSSNLIGKVHSIGNSTADNIVTAVNSISFKTGNALKAKLFSSGSFHVAADVVAYSSSLSDERLKDDVNQINGALNKIESMRGVDYTWNKGSRKGQKDIGVIAQEVEKVIPEIVKEYTIEVGEFEGDNTSYKAVDYEKLSAVLIEAVKELSAEVKELKKKLS